MKGSIVNSISKAVYLISFLSLIFIGTQFNMFFSMRHTIIENQKIIKMENDFYRIFNNEVEIESCFLNYTMGYQPSSKKITLLLAENSELIDEFIIKYHQNIIRKHANNLRQNHLNISTGISKFLSIEKNNLEKEMLLKEINETFFINRLLFYEQQHQFEIAYKKNINVIKNVISFKLLTIILLTIIILLIIIFSFHLKKFLTSKISFVQEKMIAYSKNIINNNFEQQIIYSDKDEFKGIFDTFNEMIQIILSQNSEMKIREKKYRYLFDNSRDALMISSLTGKFIDCNPALLKIFGATNKEEFTSFELKDFSPEHQADGILSSKKASVVFLKTIETGSNFFEWILKNIHGKCFDATILSSYIDIGEDSFILSTIRDISKEKQEKEKQAQSRKMDAIGQLAGGVAHDFNNMLSGIMGAAQLLQSPKQNLDKKSLIFVEMIMKAAQRAADLTSKLLAFGRKSAISSTSINIHKIVDDTIAIFNQTIDKRIKITTIKNAENFTIIGDNSALQNSFLNLGINASHAMPDGGELVIETRNLFLSKDYCEMSSFEIKAGEYIEIEFRDTGCGISPENMEKIFEPFFTTKVQGKGTGLGLSAVYGTIQDHHGVITVHSEIGVGTVFNILIPCSNVKAEKKQIVETVLSGSGKILLVDDEELIRTTGKHILEEMGYQVLLAENGKESVDLFREKFAEIDLVIMDMMMPEMNGSEAFYKIKEIDSKCKVIISSGFTKEENLEKLKIDGLSGFIQKPFRDYNLSVLIDEILKKDSCKKTC